jgi:hypothetical protein
MAMNLDVELTAETLRRAAEGLRQYRSLVMRILGETPEEVKLTLKAMEGLSPEEIRRALELYRRKVEG